MSIIYDALKKIERSQNKDSSVTMNKLKKPKPKIYLVYVLTLCLGFFMANIFLKSFTKTFEVQTNKKTPDVKEVGSPAIETSEPITKTDVVVPSEPEKKPLPQFVLNGVFFSQDQGYALINNRIVKEGDVVEGALVLRITLEEVVLEHAGSTIKLEASQ